MHFSENQKDETNGKLDLLGTMIVDMRQHFDTVWAILRERWETASELNKEMIKALMANGVTLKQVKEKAMHQMKVLVKARTKHWKSHNDRQAKPWRQYKNSARQRQHKLKRQRPHKLKGPSCIQMRLGRQERRVQAKVQSSQW